MGFAFLGCCLFVVLVVLARGLHPVSFPNLEVKPFCADGTATGGLWESRALPTVSLSVGVLVLLWGRHPHHFCLWSRRSGIVGGVLDFLTYPLLLCSQPVGRNVWGVVVGAAPIFYVFMGRLLLKVVKDTPAVRRQTY